MGVATAAEDPRPETIGLQQWTIPKGLYTYEKNRGLEQQETPYRACVREDDKRKQWCYRLVKTDS